MWILHKINCKPGELGSGDETGLDTLHVRDQTCKMHDIDIYVYVYMVHICRYECSFCYFDFASCFEALVRKGCSARKT